LLPAVLTRRLRLGGEIRRLLHQLRILRVLAVGVAAAREELAEARALERHRLATLVADDLLVLGRRVRRVALRHFLGGLALGIVRAGQELAEAAELDDHRRTAVLALLVSLETVAL